MEYRCKQCNPQRRQYAAASAGDHMRARLAARILRGNPSLCAPDSPVGTGQETRRPHAWGYKNVVDFFSARQRLALSIFAREITRLPEERIRRALLTIVSDMVRYNCELCRYDSWALKCRDAFAIHTFVIPLAYCEVNALGSAVSGTGGFPQVLKRYLRAKEYGEKPYDMFPAETGAPTRIFTEGERVIAEVVNTPAEIAGGGRRAWLGVGSADQLDVPAGIAHAVITDPPYFDFVQYRDLLDVHRAWLESALDDPEMGLDQLDRELTVKPGVDGRTAEAFTQGLSAAFRKASQALHETGLFAFTYHHSRLEAYVPLVVALLDAGLRCTLVLP
jgi:adenine-specific DNA methylase